MPKFTQNIILAAVAAFLCLLVLLVALVYGATIMNILFGTIVLAAVVVAVFSTPALRAWLNEMATERLLRQAKFQAEVLRQLQAGGLEGATIDECLAEAGFLKTELAHADNEIAARERLLVEVAELVRGLNLDPISGHPLVSALPAKMVQRGPWFAKNFRETLDAWETTVKTTMPSLLRTVDVLKLQLQDAGEKFEEMRAAVAASNRKRYEVLEEKFKLFNEDLDVILSARMAAAGPESPEVVKLREEHAHLRIRLEEVRSTLVAKDQTIEALNASVDSLGDENSRMQATVDKALEALAQANARGGQNRGKDHRQQGGGQPTQPAAPTAA